MGLLQKEKLQALIVVTNESNNKNVFYLSGFGGTTGVFVLSKKKAVLVVDGRYTARAKSEARGVTVVSPEQRSKDGGMSGYLRAAFRELNLKEGSKIGYEGMRIPVLIARSWSSTFPMKFIPTKNAVERLRQTKDTYEIKESMNAARATSRAFRDVMPRIRKGMTEQHVALLIEYALKKRGATGPSFETIVASGPNAAIPHHKTALRKLRAGDSVVIDFGGLFPSGYCSDITRTLFVPGGKPHQKLLDAYQVVLIAHKKAFDALRPGLMWKEYDRVARDYITKSGFGKHFTHGVGHSLGLDVHDPYDYVNNPFEAGTVLTDEPGIYIEGIGGVRIEDDIVITKTGAQKLSTAPYLSGTMAGEKKNSNSRFSSNSAKKGSRRIKSL